MARARTRTPDGRAKRAKLEQLRTKLLAEMRDEVLTEIEERVDQLPADDAREWLRDLREDLDLKIDVLNEQIQQQRDGAAR